jgi:hypothetical protein
LAESMARQQFFDLVLEVAHAFSPFTEGVATSLRI